MTGQIHEHETRRYGEAFLRAESKDGFERQTQLSNQVVDIFENIRTRFHCLAEHPGAAKGTPNHLKPDVFRFEVLNSIQTKPFPNIDDYRTDIYIPSKCWGEEHLFTFLTFDFPDLIGT